MYKNLEILYCKIKSLFKKDIVILAVDVANKSTMTFKNGSVVETLPIESNETTRGKRSKLPLYFDDFEYNKEEINEVLEEYIKG